MVPATFRPAGNEPPVRMNVERLIHLPTCSDRSFNNVAIRPDRVLSTHTAFRAEPGSRWTSDARL
jgi:hypothetical protein